MYYLKLSHAGSGRYFIASNNDVRLEMIAELLIDNDIRTQIKEALESFTGIPVGDVLSLKTLNGKHFEVQQATDNILYIRLLNHNSQTMETLETDLANETFIDLADEWEDLLIDEPQEIQLIREQDYFYFKSYENSMNFK